MAQRNESANQMVEDNMKEALMFAKNIFKLVIDPKFSGKYSADERHQILIKQYPNFAAAYPLILKFIAKDLKYNEKAFKKFLEKLKTDPGSGMEGFISRQADYAKFLYIEDSKTNGRHWSTKKANEIWNLEYGHMRKYMKKLEKEEKLAKNEFAEEQKANLEKKRKELLEFILREEKNEADLSIYSKSSEIEESILNEFSNKVEPEEQYVEETQETNNTMFQLFSEIRNLRILLMKNDIQYPHADAQLDKWEISDLKQYIEDLKKLIK